MKSMLFHLRIAMRNTALRLQRQSWKTLFVHFSGKSSLLFLIALLVAVATPLLAQNNTPATDVGKNAPERTQSTQTLVNQISSQTDGRTLITFNKGNGVATFMRVPQNANLDLTTVNSDSAPTEIAAAFLNRYGEIFGIRDASTELTLSNTSVDRLGMSHLTYAQSYQGVPVFAGELKAHIDPTGSVRTVNGDFVPDINVDVNPTRTLDEASVIAIEAVLSGLDLDARNASTDIRMVNNRLYIFHSGLLRRIAGQAHLAYEIEVANSTGSIHEFVYVDAHSGKIVEQISGIHEHGNAQDGEPITPTPTPEIPSPIETPEPPSAGINRQIYEDYFDPSYLIWSEGDPLPYTGSDDVEVNNMIEFAEDTYNLYATLSDGTFTSWDSEYAPMHSVLLDGFDFNCPNAYWNSESTNFCPGITSDDVVAHEWAHAYTDSTHNLIYAWQSGALNESYSDIIGEVVDLLNQRGTDWPNRRRTAGGCSIFGSGTPSVDNSYRWLLGEDTSGFGGAIRDMWNPNCYGHPAKVSDELYWCSTGDNGGVHINSGVPNHAFALLVEGGQYNGQTIAPIGLVKATHIYWRASTEYQVPATNFIEHADALEASCTDLVEFDGELPGLSTETDTPFSSDKIMTAADCGELAKAIEAVELRVEPSQCGFDVLLDPDAPALCLDAGDVQTISLSEWESGLGEWIVDSRDVDDPLNFPPNWEIITDLPQQRSGSAAFVVNSSDYGNCNGESATGVRYLESPTITLPDDVYIPRISIDHLMASEYGYDGGNIKVSINGGPWTLAPDESFTYNPYNDTLFGSNPMSGERAFTGADEGSSSGSWGQSQLNLFGIAEGGDEIKIRVEFGQDYCIGVTGWYVDDVHLYSCTDEFAGSGCGNYQIDFAETCDDGNTQSGDGCSNLCLVEDGYVCAPPIPSQTGSNVLQDGSFELGTPNPYWVEESSTFFSPIINSYWYGLPTVDGEWVAGFGFSGAPESASLEQSVAIPDTATSIDFSIWNGYCDPAGELDQVRLLIDGLEAYATNIPCEETFDYTLQSIDISDYADNAEHAVRIEADISNSYGSIFVVDNVMLSDNIPTEPVGGICVLEQAQIDVDPESITTTLQIDDYRYGGFTISNTGTSRLYWDIATDSGNRARVPQQSPAFTPATPGEQVLSSAKLSTQQSDGASDDIDSEKVGPSALVTNPNQINPLAQSRFNAVNKSTSNALLIGNTALTHSMEQDILPQNSAYCEVGTNSYLRLFNLSDFGINSTLSVTEVEVGIEQATADSDVTVNLYTLGETLSYADMTLIASATQRISETQLALVSVPFDEPSLTPDSMLVVEVVMPEGETAQIIGSNNLGQTAPTYIASPGCEIPEPVSAAAAGYADMHVVINVLGNVGEDFVACTNPAALSWLRTYPTSGYTEPDQTYFVELYYESYGLAPGLYEANICVESNAVDRPLLAIPVSMIVDGGEQLYFSTNKWGSANGGIFTDEDILVYDTRGFYGVEQLFDASDVGLRGNDLNAFAILSNGDLLMSFNYSRSIPDVGWVADTDIVRFVPTSIGYSTAGSFESYFDGSTYGLDSIGEDIDAISFTPDGQLVISTLGSYSVPGATGTLTGQDEDLLVLDEAAGTWSLYWDGTNAGLDTSSEDLWGASIGSGASSLGTPEERVYITMMGDYTVEGATDPEAPLGELSGNGNDIVVCAKETGADDCVLRPYWDGDLYGLTNLSIDAFAVAGRLPTYPVDPGGTATLPPPELQSAQIDETEVDDGDLDDDVLDGTDAQIEERQGEERKRVEPQDAESQGDKTLYMPFIMNNLP